MRELNADPLYEILENYDRLVVDYCLMENDAPYLGESSHREAVLFAMGKLQGCYPWITFDSDTPTGKSTNAKELLHFPDEPWKEQYAGTTVYRVAFTDGGNIPYWYAFLEPPHGTGSKKYSREDFDTVNRLLFPQGTDGLEVYEWSTDWSSYFDAGHEWWGTMCYSIYDTKLNRYVVIMASETD